MSTLLTLLTEHLARPWIAAKLRAPRVEISGYRLNPELSGMPCIQYSLYIDLPGGENIAAINLDIEFPRAVKDYVLAGTFHSTPTGQAQVVGESIVRSGPNGCYFDLGTKTVPPNITAAMIPAPSNKFLLRATDVRETITGKFIVPEDPGQKEVFISGDYQYRRVGVDIKKSFNVPIKTMK